ISCGPTRSSRCPSGVPHSSLPKASARSGGSRRRSSPAASSSTRPVVSLSSCATWSRVVYRRALSTSVSEEPAPEEIRAAWDALAGYWDENMEAGRTWQRGLIQPAVEALLRLEPGERVLEIACGNGEFSRRMAEFGGRVLATDFSEPMLERARAHRGRLHYPPAGAGAPT